MSRFSIAFGLIFVITSAANAKPPAAKREFHWKDYAGPKGARPLTGDKAWAAVPSKGEFEMLHVALRSFVRSQGAENVFKEFTGDDEVFVPALLTNEAPPAKGLRPGLVVMASVGGSSAYGRVVSIDGDEDVGAGQYVSIKVLWGGEVNEERLAADEVIVLDDSLRFGQPALLKDKDDYWSRIQVVFSDKTTICGVAFGGRLVCAPTARVKPIRMLKPFAKGAKVQAIRLQSLEPGVVTEVVANGAVYRVKFADGEVDLVGLDKIIPF